MAEIGSDHSQAPADAISKRCSQSVWMATIAWPPNTALELTPQSGEQDRRDFGIWNQPRRLPDLSGGAAQRQAVRRLPSPPHHPQHSMTALSCVLHLAHTCARISRDCFILALCCCRACPDVERSYSIDFSSCAQRRIASHYCLIETTATTRLIRRV